MFARLLPLLLLTLAAAVDRLLKVLALNQLLPDGMGPLHFTLVRNNALAFSVPIFETVALGLAVFALVVLVWLMVRNRSAWWSWPWLTIVLGGASNVYDRIRYGAVIDYLQLGSRSYFNLADLFIGVGIIALVIHELTARRRRA